MSSFKKIDLSVMDRFDFCEMNRSIIQRISLPPLLKVRKVRFEFRLRRYAKGNSDDQLHPIGFPSRDNFTRTRLLPQRSHDVSKKITELFIFF